MGVSHRVSASEHALFHMAPRHTELRSRARAHASIVPKVLVAISRGIVSDVAAGVEPALPTPPRFERAHPCYLLGPVQNHGERSPANP